ncbi:MAG TPA: ComEC family competence protein, partial [bacterium]|nr:ComEC family competence protein [bacterium]
GEITLKGTLIREPNIKEGKTQYVFKPDFGAETAKDYGYILISLPRYPEYFYGDYLEITGKLEEPPIFDEFSYKEYLKTQEIVGIINRGSAKRLDNRGNQLFRAVYGLKYRLRERVKSQLGEPHASLLLGILLGTRSGMPEKFNDNLSVTGTTHIIAASGYNVSVLLAALIPLRGIIGRNLTFSFSVVLLILFSIVVGLDNIPAMRASVMGLVYLVTLKLGRKGSILTILAFTAAGLVYLNPFVINSLSFQLSFLSTIGMVVLSGKLAALGTRLPHLIGQELAPTLSAIIATTPITVMNFQKFSAISLFVNLLILPVIPLIMLMGFILILLNIIISPIGEIFSYLVYYLLEYMIYVVSKFGELTYALIDVSFDKAIPVAIYLILGFIFLNSLYIKHQLRYER